jgi:hypothetical protein
MSSFNADLKFLPGHFISAVPAKRIFFTGSMIVFLIAASKLLLHLYAARNYGYFVDELYFIACGNHLAWGYVDMPPLIAVMMKLTRLLFGESLDSLLRRCGGRGQHSAGRSNCARVGRQPLCAGTYRVGSADGLGEPVHGSLYVDERI